MNYLLTGGAGFIGSNLVHHLLSTDEDLSKIVVLDKLSYAGNRQNLASIEDDPRFVFVEGDICDHDTVSKLLNEHSIDRVFHLAAESHVDRSIESPEPFLTANVLGTLRLLEATRSYWKELEDPSNFRFLHISTDEVYGSLSSTDPAFSETTPYTPNSPYSASKAASDHFVRAYFHTYGMPVLTTNCSNNYGPYQFPEKLIPLMIRKALTGEKLPVYGDGSNVRDWLYVEDHCRALALVMAEGKLGEVYNIGGDNEVTNKEVVEEIIARINASLPEEQRLNPTERIEYVTDRPGHDQRYAIDFSKIKNELGWQPQEDFSSGLDKTLAWYRENEAWIQEIEEKNYQLQRLGI